MHYVASKGGVLSLTRALALELAPYRIRVNAIAPGLTDTAQPRYGSSEAEIAETARAIPLGRMALPEEIARAAVFLASDNAGFVTGQTLHVNGGSYLAGGACTARTCEASSEGSRAGSPRAMPHSVATPATLAWRRAAASRAISPPASSWWIRPR